MRLERVIRRDFAPVDHLGQVNCKLADLAPLGFPVEPEAERALLFVPSSALFVRVELRCPLEVLVELSPLDFGTQLEPFGLVFLRAAFEEDGQLHLLGHNRLHLVHRQADRAQSLLLPYSLQDAGH